MYIDAHQEGKTDLHSAAVHTHPRWKIMVVVCLVVSLVIGTEIVFEKTHKMPRSVEHQRIPLLLGTRLLESTTPSHMLYESKLR